MSAEETKILQKGILLFLSESPHSNERKQIIENTLGELLKIAPENWNIKRVRNWFSNHRSEYKKKIPKSLLKEPPTKIQKNSKSKNTIISMPQITAKPNVTIENGNGNNNIYSDTTDDSDTGRVNSLKYYSMNPFAEFEDVDLTNNNYFEKLLEKRPKFDLQDLNLNSVNLKLLCFRIFACRAVGPDKSPREPWLTKSRGTIILYESNLNGRINWKHDRLYNKFKGKLNKLPTPEALFGPTLTHDWSNFQLSGTVGDNIMEEFNFGYKNKFPCFFRMITAENILGVREKLDKKRMKEIKLLGENQYNTELYASQNNIMTGDLEGKLQFSTSQGRLCGVKIYARSFDPFTNPDQSKKSVQELQLALKTLQDQLKVICKSRNLCHDDIL